MKYAMIQDGKVREVFDELPIFHPDVMKTIIEAPDGVEQHWLYDGSNFTPVSKDES